MATTKRKAAKKPKAPKKLAAPKKITVTPVARPGYKI
jgi:hypothetical protein